MILLFLILILSSITGKKVPETKSFLVEITFGCLNKLLGVNKIRVF